MWSTHTPRSPVYVNGSLGPEQLDTVKPAELCVPSTVLDPECELLNGAECLLPYPSNRFTVADPSTDTGLRVDLPAKGMPKVTGPAVLPDPFNELDGFSPTAQILMHFPQGVDLERSNAARLLEPGCCGQPAGPPWIDTRTYDSRSLDDSSPSVLLDATTGERILHWLEKDGHAEGNPARQALILRPGHSLLPNRRYIVAMRNLQTSDGTPIEPEAAFKALRDDRPTDIDAIERRRQIMEGIFGILGTHGIAREELVLAFDFHTQSEEQLTGAMLSMRDQAYAWLEEVANDPEEIPFTVSDVQEKLRMHAGGEITRPPRRSRQKLMRHAERSHGDPVGGDAIRRPDFGGGEFGIGHDLRRQVRTSAVEGATLCSA